MCALYMCAYVYVSLHVWGQTYAEVPEHMWRSSVPSGVFLHSTLSMEANFLTEMKNFLVNLASQFVPGHSIL